MTDNLRIKMFIELYGERKASKFPNILQINEIVTIIQTAINDHKILKKLSFITSPCTQQIIDFIYSLFNKEIQVIIQEFKIAYCKQYNDLYPTLLKNYVYNQWNEHFSAQMALDFLDIVKKARINLYLSEIPIKFPKKYFGFSALNNVEQALIILCLCCCVSNLTAEDLAESQIWPCFGVYDVQGIKG
ncbi:Hypothetical_protein [Hexamita inflata]|uniref:Hypothetical_protein n=1 Tax=Hexamita inflata TaxID=28002 RepID=A0AA86PLP6_9EUKA|nr:Hypothetical protein HINF_LOCUS25252 [Hexamita inflata]